MPTSTHLHNTQSTKSNNPQNIVDLAAHLLYNTTLQDSSIHPHPILCDPCSTQARYAIVHADYSALMSTTDHKSLTLAIDDTSKKYPACTLAASQTILSQLHHTSPHRVALFTGADTPTQPAPLTQLSSRHPTSLYSYTDALSLTGHTCFVTHQHQLHLLSPLTVST